MSRHQAVFLVNLLQDVNILRPLVQLAARALDLPVLLLLSGKFVERDLRGVWQTEVQELCADSGASSQIYDSASDAARALAGKRGVLVAASESSLSAHRLTHDVFRAAPPSFLKVTLQHGFECVGFLQNRDQDAAHGRNVTFAADVICGWCDPAVMHSVAASERAKYYWSGPAAVLEPRPAGAIRRADFEGLVCENLHSARMSVRGDFRAGFMENFFAFCAELERQGRGVTLRPHPGGQYVVKNAVSLPANVRLNNLPMYKVDLRQYGYGISAPSSVVIDMVLAGIPAAVWLDDDGRMDGSYYRGLTTISGTSDWLEFEHAARHAPQAILEQQLRFLAKTRMLVDPIQVRDRFASLLTAGSTSPAATVAAEAAPPRQRVLFVANGMIPTLQLSFLKPLAPDVEAGTLAWKVIVGDDIKKKQAELNEQPGIAVKDALRAWLDETIAAFAPTVVVFCRYSDRFAAHIVDRARSAGAAVVYHIDDDLLNVPIEIGEAKFRVHNAPDRLATVRYLLEHADLVYCSTQALVERFRELGFSSPMVAGDVYCTGTVLAPAELRPVTKIGYMGFDHAHDLATILPALVHVLRTHPHVAFELFGSIPKPVELDEFAERVSVIPPVRVYADFMRKFASLGWDIGLCPLARSDFNRVKANTKWVEYTSIGAAVVATSDMVYDECCAGGCGVLADTTAQWILALERLCAQPEARCALVRNAQARLEKDYSDEQLRRQIMAVFARARTMAAPSAVAGSAR